jgi:sec-independent protein translocase protein TatB
MFDIGWGELLVIGIVALIAIGPKELPGALRTLGQWMGKVRRMAGEFQNQFHEAMREAELSDLKKEVDEMAAKATSYTEFDPIGDVRKEIEGAVGELPSLDASANPPPKIESVAPLPPTSGATADASQSAASAPIPAGEPPASVADNAAMPQPTAPAAEPAHAPAAPTAESKPEAGKTAA